MMTRERSSRSIKALGIFYLVTGWRCRRRCAVIAIALVTFLGTIVPLGQAGEETMTTRRQPGILTGMPFMAHMAPRTFVDDAGRKLFLAQAPRRIVSLAPSVTEMLYAVGAGDRLVAVTALCDYPPEALAKPKVGQLAGNLETLVALRPDLIIAPEGFLSAEVIEQFERLKFTFMILRAGTVDDILRHVTMLGRLVNRAKESDHLVAELRARLHAVKTMTQGKPPTRLLYVLNMEPLITVGPQTFIHHVITVAGGINIAEEAVTDYPRLSMETVVAKDPEALVFPIGDTEGIPEVDRQQWHRWSTMSAVRNGRFIEVPSVLLDRPGPRLLDGLEQLARALHPDTQADMASPPASAR